MLKLKNIIEAIKDDNYNIVVMERLKNNIYKPTKIEDMSGKENVISVLVDNDGENGTFVKSCFITFESTDSENNFN